MNVTQIENLNKAPESESKKILEQIDQRSDEALSNIIQGSNSILEMVDGVENSEQIEGGGESVETQEKKAKGGAPKKDDTSTGFTVTQGAQSQVIFPPQKKMVIKIRKEIKKELTKLEKEAKKYKRPWNFRPDKLTDVVSKIRKLRELLERIVRMAIDKLRKLYTQWVINHDYS